MPNPTVTVGRGARFVRRARVFDGRESLPNARSLSYPGPDRDGAARIHAAGHCVFSRFRGGFACNAIYNMWGGEFTFRSEPIVKFMVRREASFQRLDMQQSQCGHDRLTNRPKCLVSVRVRSRTDAFIAIVHHYRAQSGA
jgi:hypothetical protein